MTIAFAEKTKANAERWPNSFCLGQMRWRHYRHSGPLFAIGAHIQCRYIGTMGFCMNRLWCQSSVRETGQEMKMLSLIKQKAPIHPPRPFADRESPIHQLDRRTTGGFMISSGLAGMGFMGAEMKTGAYSESSAERIGAKSTFSKNIGNHCRTGRNLGA